MENKDFIIEYFDSRDKVKVIVESRAGLSPKSYINHLVEQGKVAAFDLEPKD